MDAVLFVFLFALPLVAFWLVGLRFWFWMFVGIASCFAGTELVAFVSTHHTISQQFWAFSLEHPARAWLVIGLLMGFWLVLMLHLAWKMIKRSITK